MAGLQRSSETFRRSGSSGLVWEDRFLPGEMEAKEAAAAKKKEDQDQPQPQPQHVQDGVSERNQSAGGSGHGYRTSRILPVIDPPSPKPSGCCFGIFGNPEPVSKNKVKAKGKVGGK